MQREELTYNMRLILQHMNIEGENLYSYTTAMIATSTGLNRQSAVEALEALYTTHRRVERLDTGRGILWRKLDIK